MRLCAEYLSGSHSALDIVSDPKKYDFVFGKGADIRDRRGNQRMVKIVRQHAKEYLAASFAEKRGIGETIVEKIKTVDQFDKEDGYHHRYTARFLIPCGNRCYKVETDSNKIVKKVMKSMSGYLAKLREEGGTVTLAESNDDNNADTHGPTRKLSMHSAGQPLKTTGLGCVNSQDGIMALIDANDVHDTDAAFNDAILLEFAQEWLDADENDDVEAYNSHPGNENFTDPARAGVGAGAGDGGFGQQSVAHHLQRSATWNDPYPLDSQQHEMSPEHARYVQETLRAADASGQQSVAYHTHSNVATLPRQHPHDPMRTVNPPISGAPYGGWNNPGLSWDGSSYPATYMNHSSAVAPDAGFRQQATNYGQTQVDTWRTEEWGDYMGTEATQGWADMFDPNNGSAIPYQGLDRPRFESKSFGTTNIGKTSDDQQPLEVKSNDVISDDPAAAERLSNAVEKYAARYHDAPNDDEKSTIIDHIVENITTDKEIGKDGVIRNHKSNLFAQFGLGGGRNHHLGNNETLMKKTIQDAMEDYVRKHQDELTKDTKSNNNMSEDKTPDDDTNNDDDRDTLAQTTATTTTTTSADDTLSQSHIAVSSADTQSNTSSTSQPKPDVPVSTTILTNDAAPAGEEGQRDTVKRDDDDDDDDERSDDGQMEEQRLQHITDISTQSDETTSKVSSMLTTLRIC